MTLLRRFLADETAGGGLNYLLATSVASLFALGTIHEARLVVTDKFDALVVALKKQGLP